ncbi:MAG TPA: hypothetical protein VES67_19270 [Vicinamibacterales bacterium]|nr:hypothetical protein [Vicinamibacterales bacterium]
MTRTALAGAWLSVTLLWSQFFLASRYASVEGALHGSKRLLYLAVLVAASAALLLPGRRTDRGEPDRALAIVALAAGVALMTAGCLVWFPPSSWSAIPYLDNWTTRFLSTSDGVALLKHGAAVGWNWDFLGGYHTASDITQSLTLLGLAPMLLFGDAAGFHLLHVVLLLGIPAVVYLDLRLDGDPRLAALGAGLSAFGVASIAYVLLRSGDTNSLAGVATTMLALTAAHAAALGRRWGAPLLVITMAMVAWSHAGFLAYVLVFLLMDAALARDRHRAIRAVGASLVAVVAALPLTWELWRYPSYFIANNVMLDPSHPIDWLGVARKVFYNVELFWLPGRWFNDVSGLTYVLLPLLALTGWRARGRVQFYAVAAVGVMALTRLQSPESAYFFVRPMHLLAVFTPVAVAGFVSVVLQDRWRRWALATLAAIYLPLWWHSVPHQRAETIEPELVQHLRGLDGALVLLENTPHRDMDADPTRDIEPAPVPAHFESIVPRLTGVRLYAGMWDGWQWCPQRRNVLAGGAFRGASISVTPPADVHAELTRWGVQHLVVWSNASNRFFESDPAFVRRWSAGPWTHFEFLAADPHEVVVAAGRGHMTGRTPLGARVQLDGVRQGDRIVVRTNFYPAWTAWTGSSPVTLVDDRGLLAFDAPREGSYEIELRYPARTWLLSLAFGLVLAATLFAAVSPGAGRRRYGRAEGGR